MNGDSREKLSATTICLHWIVAVLTIGLLTVGVYMVETKGFWLYPWHKSFGVTLGLFVILRVLWRIKNGWPEHVGDYTSIEQFLAKLVHYLLIIGTVLMPISGFLMSAMGGHGVAVFGWELFHHNPDPTDPSKVIPINGTVAGIAHSLHWIAGYSIIAGVVLHVVGAVKHHVVDKDGTLRRMFGRRV